MRSSIELRQEADALEAKATELRNQAAEQDHQALLLQPLAERLIYAATTRCPCGAGLAYDPAADDVRNGDGAWDCSAILLGTAIPKGQPGSVVHEAALPFRFYEIKSERQPSSCGQTTRPPKES